MALDFSLTPEQEAMKESCKKFAEKEISPGALERDIEGKFHLEGFRKCGEFGLLGLPIPQEYGGGGADIITFMAAMEGFGYGCRDGGFNLSLGAHIVICTIPIWLFGTEEQKKKYLPKLCSGEWIGGLALTEPNAGSDVANIQTTAVRKGDKYILNGTKMFITNGPIANVLVTMATVDRSKRAGGITAFIVENTFPGFSVGKHLDKMGMRSSPTSEIIFEDCEVPAENILGKEGQGFMVAMETLGWERSTMTAVSIGGFERLLEKCVQYAQERVQFGKPIGKFQEIQHKIADMKCALEIARLLIYKCAWQKSKGINDMVFNSITKLVISELAVKNALSAIQIHGGYGYMREFEVERGLRDSVLATIGGGTSEIQRSIIARSLLKL